MLYGALEAGGTKMVCAIGDETGKIYEQISIPTITPEETIPRIVEYFKTREIAALGVACFGPIDVKAGSDTYGYILNTPKIPWRNYDILGSLKEALGLPMGFDTDVNGSLLGEMTWGNAKGLTDVVYITIGTGVGAGILSGGNLVHGMLHSEAGHMKLVPVPGDKYPGRCPSHGNCLEGMAAGPAVEERWGMKGKDLVDRPEVWELEADYIAQAIMNMIMILSPQRFILGGGIMHQEQLFPLIRRKVTGLVNGYISTKELEDMDTYIVPAGCKDDQGILGCICLAINAEKSL